MMTDLAFAVTSAEAALPLPTTQKVVIVNGSAEMLDALEAALEAGHYDIIFVESSDHAYS